MKILGCGKHGSCIGPNQCACEIGWQGVQCDKCVSVPGCLHGKCVDKSFGCVCDNPAEWSGSLCNIRKYWIYYNDTCQPYVYITLLRNYYTLSFSLAVCPNGCVHGVCNKPGICK